MNIVVNEDNIRLLADSGCPRNLWGINDDFYCLLHDDDTYYELYNGSVIDVCRTCWLKWLSKESEDNHE
jgi:hypothetical protein